MSHIKMELYMLENVEYGKKWEILHIMILLSLSQCVSGTVKCIKDYCDLEGMIATFK